MQWVPAPVDIDENEVADILPKEASQLNSKVKSAMLITLILINPAKSSLNDRKISLKHQIPENNYNPGMHINRA
ncbi:hypothetical protein TNIN_194331 [Trichonephila inaurata madagascariensis]|uniref:Uncharacterized protein n=1 Tax=Trichonephila inaurata madagascariensis TaxID=2747483 RepID=A0A8X6WPG7_9ARAC|nr:hypothetical protein TNIN_194331 [Trichonephila inaurata madagascariensis]